MFPIVRTTVNLLARLPKPTNLVRSSFHLLAKPQNDGLTPNFPLLAPKTVSLVPACGFKVKGWLKKRCKDCFFVQREGRLYVLCKTHPRHKQMSMVKDPKSTWILTHATQSKVRPW